MKIRSSFVANSSSSSFIIATRDAHVTPEFSNVPLWVNKIIKNLVSTLEHNIDKTMTTQEELDEYIKWNWGCEQDSIEDVLEDCGKTLREAYHKASRVIAKGMKVHYISIDNNEETLQDIINSLPEDEDGDLILVMSMDY
jgi:hypothetical protein